MSDPLVVREWRRLATAATFLTRAPWVARHASGDPLELARSARWFPLVGIAVGLWGAGVFALAALAWPIPLAALLALCALVLATGAFHEDGLADAADGLFGGHAAARRLEIMRDSRIGTFGAAALVLVLALRWQALCVVGPAAALLVLPAAHAAARLGSLALALGLPYVREGAPNKPVADGIGLREAWIGAATTALAFGVWALHAGALPPLAAALAAALVVAAAGAVFARKVGGITGDCLGAANQLAEVAILLVAAALAGGP